MVSGDGVWKNRRVIDVVGADVYKKGWIAIQLLDGVFGLASVRADLEAVARAYDRCVVMAVDVPIGLPSVEIWDSGC